MTKIVYNTCFGGYSLSKAAMMRYAELKGITLYPDGQDDAYTTYWTVPEDQRDGDGLDEFAVSNILSDSDISRTDPVLVQVIEELGSKIASGEFAKLAIIDVPAGTKYRIDEYDGTESIMTVDDYDWHIA